MIVCQVTTGINGLQLTKHGYTSHTTKVYSTAFHAVILTHMSVCASSFDFPSLLLPELNLRIFIIYNLIFSTLFEYCYSPPESIE